MKRLYLIAKAPLFHEKYEKQTRGITYEKKTKVVGPIPISGSRYKHDFRRASKEKKKSELPEKIDGVIIPKVYQCTSTDNIKFMLYEGQERDGFR